ncbi:hypothetical protein E2C01_031318 [Portunus trituberculatus]|uniref:Uncharacterized protein n=1 Tax=Portunus trituberculatus TaxID=210409 RepID=A0A5B7EZR9_PORTR|nr:hypothetical protein [Portunus trituberculatus]
MLAADMIQRRGQWVVLSSAETHWRDGVGTNRIVFKVMCAATMRRCSALVSCAGSKGAVGGWELGNSAVGCDVQEIREQDE